MGDLGRFGAFRSSVSLQLELIAEGPILVRGPDAFVPDAPDMAFVRVPTPHGDAPFVPGSSLKGVLRSGAEALLRGLGEDACDPTARDRGQRGGCGRCRACRTFGSSSLGAAVILVGDGMPWPPDADEEGRRSALATVERRRSVRSGVAIDRQRGSVAVGPFDMEVLAAMSFYPTLTLRNPEPWQLHLLAATLQLLDAGQLRVGSGTTKGLGRVRVKTSAIAVRCLDPGAADPLVGNLAARRRRDGPFWVVELDDPDAAIRTWAERIVDDLEGG